jgi:hypothetical protein
VLIYPVNEKYIVIRREEEKEKNVMSDSQGRTRCGLRSSDAPSLWFVDLHARYAQLDWLD